MYKIIRKEVLNPTITLLEIEAPFVAKKAKPDNLLFFVLTKRENAFR